eukprot:TRINITY_DN2088_c0_g1_i1.p1 TRINITY_DN2088_c0_g1~~TRINITY_DN2088_c0_g1_i1.p1  ORF type:complete len:309 (-),score=15.16 TRINITY_DN2088_c0_g1_i1:179-1105(-)
MGNGLLAVLFLVLISDTSGRCFTPFPPNVDLEEIENRISEFPSSSRQASETIQIKIYWHVLTNGSDGNLTEEAIQDQLAVLNDAYKSSPFQFVTQEIERVDKPEWFIFGMMSELETEVKDTLYKGTFQDINVYTNGIPASILGWSYLPFEGLWKRDGVVLTCMSFPGGPLPAYNEGKTLVHEIGHWFGLYHVFEGGCSGDGDHVYDTPACAMSFGCPSDTKDSCSSFGKDPIHNYLGYTDDACMYEFTEGQHERMLAVFQTYRAGNGTAITTGDAGDDSTSTTGEFDEDSARTLELGFLTFITSWLLS